MKCNTRVEKVFWEAAAMPPENRPAYLDNACDGELRRDVERLLAAHEATGPNLIPRDPGAGRDALIGSRAGQHTIERFIGEGGMGRVYEAVQDSPRRAVAIKVLHDWVRGGPEARRFEDEGRALAKLHHPGIAYVYEAGVFTHQGRDWPYLVMELIEGARVITEAARGLGLRDRLELAARTCEAVHHAHLRGIIHRDLKPANILVDGSGQPKVIDFGVARVIGAADRRTLAGQLIGTPAYMSPEQCTGDAGDVDARTDVYSLGAILYEIVCGRRAFEVAGGSITDVLRAIALQEPPAPSSVTPAVPRDVELMVRHAMAKDRDQRYQSAGGLAQDIRRYLAGEPISISAPGAARRAFDWALRHPIIATTCLCASIAALSLTGTLAGVYVLALRPDHLVLGDGQRFVALESRGGQRLKTWEADPGGTIVLSAVVDKPESMGRMILIGFQPLLTGAATIGRVEAFEMSDPAHRLWSTADWPLHPPDQYAERREVVPAIDLAMVEDVLAESPGPELIVIHSLNPFSPSAIRIFDLGGVLRYEAWHEGAIYSVRWLPGCRRLLLTGLNCEARWDERGAKGLRPCYPYIVAAIEPKFGRLGQGRWLVAEGREPDETLRWYQWLGPPEHLESLQDANVILQGPGLGWDQDRSATVALRRDAFMGIELNFVVDGEGRTLARWTNDGYKAGEREGKLPAPESFRLLPYLALPRPIR